MDIDFVATRALTRGESDDARRSRGLYFVVDLDLDLDRDGDVNLADRSLTPVLIRAGRRSTRSVHRLVAVAVKVHEYDHD